MGAIKASLYSSWSVKKALNSESLDKTKKAKQNMLRRIRKKNIFAKKSWLTAPLLLTACNNDNKKLLGLAGNAASEGIEKHFQENPSISNPYTISSTTPLSSTGDGFAL